MPHAASGDGFARELEVAKALAQAAGRVVLEFYRAGVEVDYKDAAQTDPVTSADKAANELLVTGLQQAFPGDAILAEESPEDAAAVRRRQRCQRLWCVDPIDGTREFLARSGHFMVMLGLAVDGRAALGVLLQPTTGALFWGSGDAAFVEDASGRRPLRVSTTAQPAAATLALSRSHRSPTLERIAAALGISGRLPAGSVGLKMARLAQAQADLYISTSNNTREWDVCGPEAILRAAGGRITDLRGEALRYNGDDTRTLTGICASNGPLHPPALREIAQILGRRVIDD